MLNFFQNFRLSAAQFSDLVKTNTRYWPRTRVTSLTYISTSSTVCLLSLSQVGKGCLEGIDNKQLFPGYVLCFRIISHHSHQQSLTSYWNRVEVGSIDSWYQGLMVSENLKCGRPWWYLLNLSHPETEAKHSF